MLQNVHRSGPLVRRGPFSAHIAPIGTSVLRTVPSSRSSSTRGIFWSSQPQQHLGTREHEGCTVIARAAASMALGDDADGSQAGKARGALPEREVGFFDKARAVLFFACSFVLAVPLFLSMCLMAPLVNALDKHKRLAQHWVNNVWAKVSTSLFYPVEVVGRENLPPSDRAVVYVANHQSFLDIYSLFHLDRPFKFISKTSNFLIPVVGWSMYLTGHVGLKRMDRRSQLECLKACGELLKCGAPVLFFPEGTRSKTRVMAGFKKGAFSVACKAGVDVVPVTLLGTGDLMPSGSEGVLRGGRVKLVVHKAIPTKGRDADVVCTEARNAIASALPPELVGNPNDLSNTDDG